MNTHIFSLLIVYSAVGIILSASSTRLFPTPGPVPFELYTRLPNPCQTSHRRIQSINNASCDVYAGVPNCAAEISSHRAFLHAFRGDLLCQISVAKLLHLRVHLPSSPTMSLRSEDAETTKSRQVSFMFHDRGGRCRDAVFGGKLPPRRFKREKSRKK
jgi:hypothetical protein